MNSNNHIFDKNVECPVCKQNFNTLAVKVNSPRISSRDSDFFIRYSVVNPYFYDVWICNSCGYAAMKSDFNKIKSHQKDLILKNITSKWRGREYPDTYTAQTAIERYKLALINAITLDSSHGTQAMILLKIAWMYRLLEDDKNELIALNNALECFLDSYSTERFPIYGLHRDSFTYLIGELYRRLNKNEDALKWYSNVITTVGASQKVKEMARDGKDKIKNLNA